MVWRGINGTESRWGWALTSCLLTKKNFVGKKRKLLLKNDGSSKRWGSEIFEKTDSSKLSLNNYGQQLLIWKVMWMSFLDLFDNEGSNFRFCNFVIKGKVDNKNANYQKTSWWKLVMCRNLIYGKIYVLKRTIIFAMLNAACGLFAKKVYRKLMLQLGYT